VTNYTLWGTSPAGLPGSSTVIGQPSLLGTLFTVTEDCYLVGYRWYVVDGTQPASGVKFGTYQVTGDGTGTYLPASSVTSGTLTVGTAPNDVMLGTPMALTKDQPYCCVVGTDSGPATQDYWGFGGPGANGLTSGPLNVYSAQSGDQATDPEPNGNEQSLYSLGSDDPSSGFPTSSDISWTFWLAPIVSDTAPATISASRTSTAGNGVQTWSVTSALNNTGSAGPQDMRVLPPSAPSTDYPHAFLIMLPVEPGQGTTYGDSMATVLSLNAHNAYNLTCIQPGYPIDPWYGDNPNDSATSQESFTVALAQWAQQNLAVTGTEEVYLIGFSKSGIGGQGLQFRHPGVFAATASWDFPALMTDYDGSDPNGTVGGDSASVYGTSANFKNNYELDTGNLTTWKGAANFGTANRIWIGGYEAFQADVTGYDSRLTSVGIEHTFGPMTAQSHAWDTTWVSQALAAMIPASVPDDSGDTMAISAPGRSAAYVQNESPLNVLQLYDFGPSVLAGSAAFTSAVIDLGSVPGYGRWRVFAYADQAGTCALQQSSDGTTFYTTQSNSYTSGQASVYESLVALRYLRVVFTNGSSAQGSFRLLAALVGI
jgi:hypothetical protein